MPVRGARSVRSNLRSAVRRIESEVSQRAVTAALIEAAGWASLMTPVDTANLINSQYRRVSYGAAGAWGHLGYTANYAAAVHEMLGTLKGQPRAHFGKTAAGVEFGGGTGVGNYWDPDAEPKFLEKAFTQHLDDIWSVIRRSYRV